MRETLVCLLICITSSTAASEWRHSLEEAVVAIRIKGCDYFLADGPKGWFLLEWYGGYDPSRGDALVGDIASYGLKDVYYVGAKERGRVWVDDYLLSRSRAAEKLADKCN